MYVCVCVAKPVAVELRCHATALILNTISVTFLSDFFLDSNTIQNSPLPF